MMIEDSNHIYRSYLLATLTFIMWGTSFSIGKFVTPSPLSPFNMILSAMLIANRQPTSSQISEEKIFT